MRSAVSYYLLTWLLLGLVPPVQGYQPSGTNPLLLASRSIVRRGAATTTPLPILAPWGSRAASYTISTRGQPTTTTCSSSPRRSSSTSLPMMMDVMVAKASISATAKLLSSIGLGGLAALQPGVLDAAAISALSRLTYWVFQPAFLFGSVSKTLYTAATTTGGLSLRALWLMPCLALLMILAGAVLGRLVAALFRIHEEEIPNVRMCTTFGNSGPLPLIFTDALFGRNPLLQSQMAAGISFYLLAWSPLFWTLGPIVLGATLGDDNKEDTVSADMTSTVSQSARFWAKAKASAKQILSPPVIGSLAGLVVGLVPFLRNLFLSNGSLLQPLYGALQTLGTAYLPAALLVLAGSLVGKKKTTATTTSDDDDDDSASSNSPSPRGLAAIALYRFVISPALSFVLAKGLSTLTWLDARTKAIVIFLCLMEGCMPPAQNSVIMLQLVGLTGPAAAMAKLLTILYAGAVVPVTLLLTACLQQSGILAYL